MNRTFLDPYNSGPLHFRTIESYAATNTCQTTYVTTSQRHSSNRFVNYQNVNQKVGINFKSSELLELFKHVELF